MRIAFDILNDAVDKKCLITNWLNVDNLMTTLHRAARRYYDYTVYLCFSRLLFCCYLLSFDFDRLLS